MIEFLGTGRRKTAVARVRLSAGSGKITVNGRTMETYFVVDSQRLLVQQALGAVDATTKFDVRRWRDRPKARERRGTRWSWQRIRPPAPWTE